MRVNPTWGLARSLCAVALALLGFSVGCAPVDAEALDVAPELEPFSPPPVDPGPELAAVLAGLQVRIHLYEGWMGKIIVESDSGPVVKNWMSKDYCLIDVSYTESSGLDLLQCQPQRSSSSGEELPGHCRSFMKECTFSSDLKRCDCALKMDQLPDRLYIYPSDALANSTDGWRTSGGALTVDVPAVEGKLEAVAPAEGDHYVLCHGDQTGVPVLVQSAGDAPGEARVRTMVYRDHQAEPEKAETHDDLAELCWINSQEQQGLQFNFILGPDSLAECGQQAFYAYRPALTTDAPISELAAPGSFIRAGVTAPPFRFFRRDDCGSTYYPPHPALDTKVTLKPTSADGEDFMPPSYPGTLSLQLTDRKESSFFLSWLGQSGLEYWTRCNHDAKSFSPVVETPEAVRQLTDGSWVGVNSDSNTIYRAGGSGMWQATPKQYSNLEQPGVHLGAELLQVADTDFFVVALYLDSVNKSLAVVWKDGVMHIPFEELCAAGPSIGGYNDFQVPSPRNSLRLRPGKTPGQVALRQFCSREDSFRIDQMRLYFQSGGFETVGIWGNGALPEQFVHAAVTGPAFMDDELIVLLAGGCNPKMSYQVYWSDLVGPGKMLESGTHYCPDAALFEPIARSGDSLFFSWAGYCSGPAEEGQPPTCPMFLEQPIAVGVTAKAYSAPFFVLDAVHVLAALGQPGQPHVFAVDNQFNIDWMY